MRTISIHKHNMVVIIFLLQDKDFPWKIRVGYAKDIAAGMVSLSSQYSKNKNTFIAKLSCFGKKLVKYIYHLSFTGLSTLHECYPPRSKLIQLPGQRGEQMFYSTHVKNYSIFHYIAPLQKLLCYLNVLLYLNLKLYQQNKQNFGPDTFLIQFQDLFLLFCQWWKEINSSWMLMNFTY